MQQTAKNYEAKDEEEKEIGREKQQNGQRREEERKRTKISNVQRIVLNIYDP